MERVEKFLKEAETYYLATVEGDLLVQHTFLRENFIFRQVR